MNNTPTTEDRIWAALSHLSALTLGIGIVLPIIGWADQRRKSNYASFQCLQALGYQSLGFTVWILCTLGVIVLGSLIVLALPRFAAAGSLNEGSRLAPWIIFFLLLLTGLFVLYFVLPIIAAVACALGRDFRYPLMGHRLARYLGYDPMYLGDDQGWLGEEREIRWLAAMGHFSILIIIWGMLAPLTVWLLQGRHNHFLKFQSAQTLAYQFVTTLLSGIGGVLYLFGFVLLIAVMGGLGSPGLSSSIGIMITIIFGAMLLMSFVIILFVPVLHILGQWAGYRVLKGDNYQYPLLGRLVDNWISKNSAIEERHR